MYSQKIISFIAIVSLMVFAIACGGGGGGSSSLGDATVSGTLDFSDTSLSKPRSASSTSGNITLINLSTNETTIVSFTGNTFTANVASGDYEVQALRNDNQQLKLLISNVTPLQTNSVIVDIDSTVVAQWIDLYDLEINDLSDVETLLNGSSNTLTSSSNTYEDADRQSALIILALKKQLQNDITQSVNILSSTYSPSEDSITTFSTNVVSDILSSGNQVVLAGNTTIIGSANLSSFDSSTVNFDAVNTQETIVVVGGLSSSGSLSSVNSTTGALNQDQSVYEVSDLAVFGYKRKVHVLGRFSADFVERYDIDSLNSSKYSAPYSTLESSETNSLNPHNLIFGSKSQALLTRYGSAFQKFIDPTVTSSSDFLTQSIDLSDYDTNDGIPEFSAGTYVGGNYFIAAQRLDRNNNWIASSNAYLAVLGTDGNEVNTGKAATGSNLLGIELPARNPLNVVYSEDLDKIFVQCIGQYGSSYSGTNREFTGGILTVDPTTFEVNMLVDDDAGVNLSTNTYTGGGTYGGLISNVAVVSATKGYIVIYSGWQDNDLRSFNPTTGAVGDVIENFEGIDIADLKVDSQNRLWIIANTTSASQIHVLNTSTDTIDMTVDGFNVPPKSLDVIQH